MALFINTDSAYVVATNLKVAFTSLSHSRQLKQIKAKHICYLLLCRHKVTMKLFLVRNPYSRLYSIYANKVVGRPKAFYREDFYWEQCQKSLAPYLGISLYASNKEIASAFGVVTFNDFVAAVHRMWNQVGPHRMDGHFRPQWVTYKRSSLMLGHKNWKIIPIEDTQAVDHSLGFALPRENTSEMKCAPEKLCGLSIRMANDIYMNDFHLFNYQPLNVSAE